MNKKREQDTSTKPVKENVVDGVLQNYLDQLLVTATQPQKVEKTIHIPEVEESIAEPSGSSSASMDAASVNNENSVEHVEIIKVEAIESELNAEKIDEVSLDKETLIVTEIKMEKDTELLVDQESWSSQGVECLIFTVCGLKLAVPLLFLGGVHEVKAEEIKPLIGQQQWYLGMVHTDECNLQVIDTANFIMPERSRNLVDEGIKYLIQLEKTPWAIACQSIDDTVRLEASEIKWRGDRGKRTWLAGTVIEKMCALIDVSGLLKEVELSCNPA